MEQYSGTSQDLNPNPSTCPWMGNAKDREVYFLCCNRKGRAASALSFTL